MRFYGDKRYAWTWLPEGNMSEIAYMPNEIWKNIGLGHEEVIGIGSNYFSSQLMVDALNVQLAKWYEVVRWTKTIGNDLGGDPVFYSKTLWQQKKGGWHVDLHKFVQADDANKFHTHPAYAVRIILAGGYEEEVYEEQADGTIKTFTQLWRPGNVGLVAPNFCHRINSLLNGKSSHSLWIRGPVIAKIKLKGDGWPEHMRNKDSLYQSKN